VRRVGDHGAVVEERGGTGVVVGDGEGEVVVAGEGVDLVAVVEVVETAGHELGAVGGDQLVVGAVPDQDGQVAQRVEHEVRVGLVAPGGGDDAGRAGPDAVGRRADGDEGAGEQ